MPSKMIITSKKNLFLFAVIVTYNNKNIFLKILLSIMRYKNNNKIKIVTHTLITNGITFVIISFLLNNTLMRKKSFITLLLISIFFTSHVFSQVTSTYKEPKATLSQAHELFKAKKYASVRHIIEQYLSENNLNIENKIEAEFLRAISAIKLDNKDAEGLLNQFIIEHPEKSRSKKIFFQLALHQFGNKSYRNAIKNFEKTDPNLLSNEELVEYYFKYGYCYYKRKEYKKAQDAFLQIKDIKSIYSTQANYYYSYIAYENKNYNEALKGFNTLKNDRQYGNMVSYYIVHIYFQQKKYDQIIAIGTPLLEEINIKRRPELSHLIGEAWYQNNNYDKAIEYFEYYFKNTRKRISPEVNYQLAFIYYQTKQFDKAISQFQKAGNNNSSDTLKQDALYHLGMCYINTDQKKFAGNAFLSAYKIKINNTLREDALFNYVKLSYENPYAPYNNASEAIQLFLKEFPKSQHLDKINSFLVDIFLSTKDYQNAIKAFKQINNKTPRLKKAYQQITYYRGIELFNNQHYFEAIKMFKESSNYNIDNSIVAQSTYWTAEAYYQMKSYDLAYNSFEKFLQMKGIYALSIYPTAFYNMAYISFQQKKYNQAKSSFKNYIIGTKNRDPKMIHDSYIRLGDCYFIGKQYSQAIEYYNKAIEKNAADEDYAIYQKALAYGGQGNMPEKINQLNYLIQTQQQSHFRDDAEYEIGVTFLIQNNNNEALKHFNILINKYPRSTYIKKAYLKSGLIYFNNDNSNKALSTLKKVVQKYPNTVESHEALSAIKNIYVEMNNVDEYFSFAKKLNSNITIDEQDSVTYIAAENIYMKGDCEKSLIGFTNYLKKFPSGTFTLNAHFYKAQCEYKNKNYNEALNDYEQVILKPLSGFTESALAKAATILYDNKKYAKAHEYFTKLSKVAEYKDNIQLATTGLMRANYQLKNYKKAISAAENIVKDNKVSIKILNEAHLIIARSAKLLGDNNKAKNEYSIVLKNSKSEKGAEAKYFLAWNEYQNEHFKKAEKMIFEISEEFAAYDYWLAKSFILLSDVYVKTNNLFQAKQTLQSIIDNYKGEELKAIAIKKRKKIIVIEKKLEEQIIQEEQKAKKEEQNVDNY